MPNGIGYNECKVCHKNNVKFEYWEGGADHASYHTNYGENDSRLLSAKAVAGTLK